ncbi:DUF2240 family protein [Methanofollis aquaemaris]|uniref:DUF2240 family protein n=1 Tax=Methanofollis aquaemaris TaxID=126734 RepID=A0A8A3S439_9EURY|nr:DUF2240 family protein [Methanofollis aquaemaris]QSZ67047.1 DUF2240 family protein [Methanofollis aquaemaris]
MSLQVTVAAPFKQMHKGEMERSQFVFFLALDRKWMNVDQANAVLRLAEEAGMVKVGEGIVSPLFDVSAVAIPLGFRPGPEVFDAPDPCHDLVERIAAAVEREPGEVVAEMNQVIDEEFDGKLRAGAAAVLLARRYGVEWNDLLPEIRKGVTGKK